MSGVKFVHTADLHLDSPFQGIGQMDAELQRRLNEATFQVLKNVVELCLDEQVDFLLIAGDLYNAQDGSLRAQLRCREELRLLTERGIQVFIAHGNHDHCAGWRADLEWPEGVHFFPAGEVACYPFSKNGVTAAEIYGVSYPERAVSENYLPKFKQAFTEMRAGADQLPDAADPEYTNNTSVNCTNVHLDTDQGIANQAAANYVNTSVDKHLNTNIHLDHPPYRIGVLHTNVGSVTGYANYAPCTVSDLTEVGFDYWALGHVHTYQIIHPGNPLIVYSGTPQGRHPQESGAKGCVIVEASSTGVTQHRWVETDVIRWLEVVQPIDGMLGVDNLLTALNKQMDRLESELAGRTGLLQIHLTGRGQIYRDLRRPGWSADLLETLRETYAERGLYPTTITQQTQPDIEISALREEESLIGDFLKLTDQGQHLATHPELETLLKEALAPLLKEKSLRTLFAEIDRATVEKLLKASEELGIELFGLEVK